MPVVEGVLTKPSGAASFDLARDGSLVYVSGAAATRTRTLVWVDRDGREEPVAADPRPYTSVRLSPDGRRLVTTVSDQANVDLVIYDLARDSPTRFTFDPAADRSPVWTPNGERVVFASEREGMLNLFSKAADGTGEVERLTTSSNVQAPDSFSPDGRTLVFVENRDTLDVGSLSMDGDQTVEWLLETEFTEAYPAVSPDGKWMAYMSLESGQPDVFVRPFPNVDDGRWQVSTNGGGAPVWGPDGQEIFYQRGPGDTTTMMVVAVETEPTFSPGTPSLVFEGPYRTFGPGRPRTFDISPDGQQFLMIKEAIGSDATSDQQLTILVQSFDQELTRLFPDP